MLCNFTCETRSTSILLSSVESARPVVVDRPLGALEFAVINLRFDLRNLDLIFCHPNTISFFLTGGVEI